MYVTCEVATDYFEAEPEFDLEDSESSGGSNTFSV
jgi:hypothetical protein